MSVIVDEVNLVPAEPVRTHERVVFIDALRGLALLGILLVNMSFFATPMDLGTPVAVRAGALADLIASTCVTFFATGKFYSLFSLLFGLGFYLQMKRAEAAGVEFKRRWRRRMLVLLGFGLLHALLVWDGDILVVYALCGSVLFRFRDHSDRGLVAWAATLLLVPALLFSSCGALVQGVDSLADNKAKIEQGLAETFKTERDGALKVYGGDDWTRVVAHRLGEYPLGIFAMLALMGPSVLAMFLLGTWIARRGWLDRPGDHPAAHRRLLLVGSALGVPLAYLQLLTERASVVTAQPFAIDVAQFIWTICLTMLAGPALCLGYVGVAGLAWGRATGRRVLAFFAPVGRMALTSFLRSR